MNVSERSSHPSSAQIEAMIDFLERNPDLAKGFSKTLNARERSRRHWEVLSERLNSMGGTIKTYKQWTKYWSDKKSAVKKKVAAQAAARRRTGGGVEDVAELSALEERIVALYGGPEFGTGDAHLGIQLFSQSDSTQLVPPASSLIQSSGHSEVSNVPQLENLQEVIQPDVVLAPETPEETHRRSKIVRRLFESSDIFPSEPSQSSLQLYHSEPRPSTPALTLSHTPTPLSISIASPSRRGATAAISSRITSTIESAGSSSSRRVQPPSPQQSHAVTTEASPSRRGATGSGTGPSRSVPSSRRAESSSRSTRAPPPSQRRTEFSSITDRFLRVEEQQIEIQRSNTRVMATMMERSIERDGIFANAVAAVGEGLNALAEAIRLNRGQINE